MLVLLTAFILASMLPTFASVGSNFTTDGSSSFLSNVTAQMANPSTASHSSHDSCPEWLSQYIEWHKKIVSNANLVQQTPSLKFESTSAGDPGLADRMRAILWGLRVAAASNRLFLIHMQHPLPLQSVFEPNKINWLASKSAPFTQTSASINIDLASPSAPANIIYRGGSFPLAHASLSSAFPQGYDPKFDISADLQSRDSQCLFQALFKPSQKLSSAVDEEVKWLFDGNVSAEFSAAHLRGGMLTGEEHTIGAETFGDPLNNLLGSLWCLRQWQLPQLIVASTRSIRAAARLGFFNHTQGTRLVEAAHTKAPVSSDHHFQSFMEIGVLSRAKCLVITRSGYARIAFWMGGQTNCVRFVGVNLNYSSTQQDFPDSVLDNECYKDFSRHFGAQKKDLSW